METKLKQAVHEMLKASFSSTELVLDQALSGKKVSIRNPLFFDDAPDFLPQAINQEGVVDSILGISKASLKKGFTVTLLLEVDLPNEESGLFMVDCFHRDIEVL